MWLRLTVLLGVCAHIQHAQIPGMISKPTLEDYSTREHLLLICDSDSPDLTYSWVDQKGDTLSTKQILKAYRPKEDVTLTCIVEDQISTGNASITIPYVPDCSGLGGGGIAAIVLGVLFGLLLLINILVICICFKSLRAVRSFFSCFKGEEEEDDAERGAKMEQLENKAGAQ